MNHQLHYYTVHAIFTSGNAEKFEFQDGGMASGKYEAKENFLRKFSIFANNIKIKKIEKI